jgi:polysaccharide biosynthesis protein PslG
MARKLALLVALLVLVAPAATRADLPPGFVGISPQSAAKASDMALMREAGITSMRLPLYWVGVQSPGPFLSEANWGAFDHEVELAAEEEIRVMPFVWGSPEWAAEDPADVPVRTPWQRAGWARFLNAAVERYGPYGTFWEDHPDLPFLPIHRWEIWNEENIVSFANEPNPERFATLIRISGRVLHRADPDAQVIIGGFFGRPLQVPPNVASGDFLSRIYRARNVKRFFDGIGLHPYVADTRAMGTQLRNLRRIMRVHHDAATPIYLTELGWGSAAGPTRWERGLYGQASQLSRSFAMISANRLRWRLGGVWWYTWSDEGGTCSFCRSAGLLTTEREAKPSWYRFNEWTGGDPDTVPRAGSRDPGEEDSE